MTTIENDKKPDDIASDTANTDTASGTPNVDPPPQDDDPLSNERLDAMNNFGTTVGKYK